MSFFRVLFKIPLQEIGRALGFLIILLFLTWAFNGFSFAAAVEELKERADWFHVLLALCLSYGGIAVLRDDLDEIKKRLPPEEPAEQDAPEEEQDAAKEE